MAIRVHAGPLRRVGRAGHIAGYDVFLDYETNTVSVSHPVRPRQVHAVPNYGTALDDLAERPGFRLGWAEMPDDAQILYFYDRDDGNFGYALNLDCDWCSEWGDAPF